MIRRILSLLLALALLAPLALSANDSVFPKVRVVVLGDSLVAGYGLPFDQAFPARLEVALHRAGRDVSVINAGVSGDTSSGGLARLDWLLADHPILVIVELGANDALRGLDPELTRANLDAILVRLESAGVRVLLAGMKAPRNLGAEYVTAFDRIYPELAARHKIPLYPFFLKGVAGDPKLNLEDGIHPNAAGVERIVEGMLPMVLKQLP